MAIVLIGGGSGLIGTRLSELLIAAGHEVRHFSRSTKSYGGIPTYQWDLAAGTYDPSAFKDVTHVINLAGAGIADARWTASRKQLIIESRTKSTQLLKKSIAEYGDQVIAYLAGSAIGYYGNQGDTPLTEEAPPGDGFLPESVQIWEEAIAEITTELKLPTLVVRTGLVLSTKGGALAQMRIPLHFFASVYFGAGQQWYSWIHIDDICRIFIKGVEDDDFRGMFNGVATHPQRNKAFAQALIDASNKPAMLFSAPAFILKLVLGEMSHTIFDSAKVSAHKLKTTGFVFEHSDLVTALRDLITKKL